ncbi:hypothetical protein EIN_270220 [Entamoeba invadens IP1]|uniref:B30.2/SPRY domain-containing protein n=1 Tax=Entamoeba invadens IP1 TaxID=370355 RepID=A0A0A1U8I0_ENTIV|nr:hypothetical protein EIN_270220 [Entamoeba invadens IP1]ELP91136.1 hypothetical protein EIN_270220 [Entamoeba invadens IP1]|eukprot:XP_004257907.1 hypothetical protein EIN_270220 [Entamoeba invadens IP1]
MLFVLKKVTCLQLNGYDPLIGEEDLTAKFCIAHATEFSNLQEVRGDFAEVLKFYKNYTNDGKEMNVNFPKTVSLFSCNDRPIEATMETRTKIEEFKKYLRMNDEMAITVLMKEFPKDKDVFLNIGSVFRFMYLLADTQYCNDYSRFHGEIMCLNNTLDVQNSTNLEIFEEFLEKAVVSSITLYLTSKSVKKEIVIEIPKMVETLEIRSLFQSDEEEDDEDEEQQQVTFSINGKLRKFVVSNFNNTIFKIDTTDLRELQIGEGGNIKILEVNGKLPTFEKLEEISAFFMSKVQVVLNTNTLKKIDLYMCDHIVVIGNIPERTQIKLNGMYCCILPIMPITKMDVYIENSQEVFFSNTKTIEDIYPPVTTGNDGDNSDDNSSSNSDDEFNENVNNLQRQNSLTLNDTKIVAHSSEDDENENEDDEEDDEDEENSEEETNVITPCFADTEHNDVTNGQIPYDDFLFIMSSVVQFPNDNLSQYVSDLKQYIFPHGFQTRSKRISLINNRVTRLVTPPEETYDVVIMEQFYSATQPTQMKVVTETGVKVLPALLRYFEISTEGVSLFSFGLCMNEFIDTFMTGDTTHVGWTDGSVGYHGDDGYLFKGDGNGKKYGPAFGVTKNKTNVVGCAYDITNQTVFFTFNGKALKRIKFETEENIDAVIVLENFKTIKINQGEEKFVFNVEKEIQRMENELLEVSTLLEQKKKK